MAAPKPTRWRWTDDARGGRAGAVLGLAACGTGDDDGGPDAASEALEPERAPSYEAVTLDGDPVSLQELRGEVVLLNVWATWCTPCRREIPELQALHEEHADDGLRVVGITVDSRCSWNWPGSVGPERRALPVQKPSIRA